MIFRIGCVDGHTYTSDHTPDAELQAHIDEHDGYIFTGDLADKRVRTVEEALEEMSVLFKHDTRNHTQNISLTIDKVDRTFNVQHIVWFEFTPDES